MSDIGRQTSEVKQPESDFGQRSTGGGAAVLGIHKDSLNNRAMDALAESVEVMTDISMSSDKSLGELSKNMEPGALADTMGKGVSEGIQKQENAFLGKSLTFIASSFKEINETMRNGFKYLAPATAGAGVAATAGVGSLIKSMVPGMGERKEGKGKLVGKEMIGGVIEGILFDVLPKALMKIPGFGMVLGIILKVIGPVVSFIGGVIDKIFGIVTGLFSWFSGDGKEKGMRIVVGTFLIGVLVGFLDKMFEKLTGKSNVISTTISSIIDGFRNYFWPWLIKTIGQIAFFVIDIARGIADMLRWFRTSRLFGSEEWQKYYDEEDRKKMGYATERVTELRASGLKGITKDEENARQRAIAKQEKMKDTETLSYIDNDTLKSLGIESREELTKDLLEYADTNPLGMGDSIKGNLDEYINKHIKRKLDEASKGKDEEKRSLASAAIIKSRTNATNALWKEELYKDADNAMSNKAKEGFVTVGNVVTQAIAERGRVTEMYKDQWGNLKGGETYSKKEASELISSGKATINNHTGALVIASTGADAGSVAPPK